MARDDYSAAHLVVQRSWAKAGSATLPDALPDRRASSATVLAAPWARRRRGQALRWAGRVGPRWRPFPAQPGQTSRTC